MAGISLRSRGITEVKRGPTAPVTNATTVKAFLANSVTGATTAAGTIGVDHTTAIQALINSVSAAAQSVSGFAVGVIECPNLYYRVQNLVIPGNVELSCNGTVFQYVDASLSPPTGYGNYVLKHYGNYGRVRRLTVLGNGAAQAGVGGVWCMPANVNGSGNPRAYKALFEDVTINNLGHRGIFDQGVNTQWSGGLVQNVLLAQTSPPYFLGAFESAGSDMMLSKGELTPSVTTGNGQVLGGIPVPRAPSSFLQTASTTTNGSINLPLSGATITLNSTAFAVATGGAVLIGGTLIAYTGVSGATLTGCTSGGSGTIATSTNVFAPLGFCASLLLGGVSDWVSDTDAEIGDVSVVLGPSLLGISQQTVTLTTTPQTLTVDNNIHFSASGGTLQVVNTASNVWTLQTFVYTGISGSTTLTGCATTSGTLGITTGQAVLSIQSPTQTHTTQLRGDLSMTHAWIVGPGDGRHVGAEALRAGVTADNIYQGFYAPQVTGGVNHDFITPIANSSSVTNKFQFAIVDQNASGANYNRWIKPRQIGCHSAYFTGNTSGGWFDLVDSPGVLLATGATPGVSDNTAFVDQNSGATTITNFTGGVNGQEITVLQGTNTTISNNANIVTKSGANITPPVSGFAALRFKKIGNGVSPTPAWYQL